MNDSQAAASANSKGMEDVVHIGEVLDYGAAPYDFKKNNTMSYFLILDGANNGKPLWGKLLEDAIRDSRTQIGDVVSARVLSRKSVTVDELVRDGAGNITDRRKKPGFLATWKVDPYEPPRVHVPADHASRDASAAPKEVVRNIPAERGAYAVKLAREIATNVWNKLAGRRATPTVDIAPGQPVAPPPGIPAAADTANRDIKEILKQAQPDIKKRIQAVRDTPARAEPGPESLKDMHATIFSGLPGAGQYRSIDEGARGALPAWAARAQDVERRVREMFGIKEDHFHAASHESLIEGIATRFVAVTKLRAFEYGNMTVAKLDAEKAAERAGLRLDMFAMDRQRLNDATRAAIHNDFGPMRKLMDEHAAPLLAASDSESLSNSTWSASYVYGQSQSPPAFVSRGKAAERHSAAATGPRQSRESATQSQRPAATAKPDVGAGSPTEGGPRRNRGRAAAYAP
jgi:hypothetical protein